MWFPRRNDESVRSEQSQRAVRQLRAASASVLCVMAIVLATQWHAGFGWGALAWQCAMAALCFAIATARLNRWPVYAAGAYGVGWAVGLVAWAPASGPQIATLVVAIALTHVAYGAASFYYLPWAVVAFSAPLMIGAAGVVVHGLDSDAAALGFAIVILHGAASLWFLRRNWHHFVRMIDMDAEKKRLADMLQQQKEIAERAVTLKSRFLASASHDLRQPMHAISLYLGGLMELDDLPPKVKRAIRDARECAYDMNDMFRSLLDIARLDAQQAVPTLAKFSMAAMVSRIEKEFAPLAHSRDVRLTVHARDVHVYSDAVMVERILQNFVSNAIRHTPGGRVLVACRTFGRTVRLAVYDNGRGIPLEQQQAIFEEFRRLESSPPDHTGGLGLGLAIVRRLAQTLKVTVTVRSAPGHGSMFAVDLPLVHAAVSSVKPVASADALAGKLVVLIDDEVPILNATSFILERAGCAVIGARSAREALDALATSARIPDAIVCDYELNDALKGPAVIQALRDEFNSEIPALLVTGDTGGGGIEELARQMRVPLLYKPLESAALTGSLGSLLTA